jgi:glycogen operon protein
MVHGNESPIDVTLPDVEGVTRYVELWSSIDERPRDVEQTFEPGDIVPLPGTSMRLFRAE